MLNFLLDSSLEIKKIDKSGMLNFCLHAFEHYKKALDNADNNILDFGEVKKIILAGMGGSGIGGELVKEFVRFKSSIPVDVSKDYYLPRYANEDTLVILLSYSGNTEETLSSFIDALDKKCKVYCISSGGVLLEYAKKLKVPYLQIPDCMPPRAAFPYMIVPLMLCLEKIGVLSGVKQSFLEVIEVLKKISEDNAPDRLAESNLSKRLALDIQGCLPVVYGFGVYRGVALRWKQQFNENSKIPAIWDFFSELNHNEIEGWENSKELGKNCAIVLIRDEKETFEINSRIEISKKLIRPVVNRIFEVWTPKGGSDLTKILAVILIGDFTSVYLAVLNNVDPTPVETITILKDKMEKTGAKQKIVEKLEKVYGKQLT